MTDQPKWTPGPWFYSGRIGFGHLITAPAQSGSRSQIAVAYGHDDDAPDTIGQANAHLIAAAPELYEALAALIDGRSVQPPPATIDGGKSVAYRNWELIEAGRAALSRARGSQ